jgi:hypothetical protein
MPPRVEALSNVDDRSEPYPYLAHVCTCMTWQFAVFDPNTAASINSANCDPVTGWRVEGNDVTAVSLIYPLRNRSRTDEPWGRLVQSIVDLIRHGPHSRAME